MDDLKHQSDESRMEQPKPSHAPNHPTRAPPAHTTHTHTHTSKEKIKPVNESDQGRITRH